MREGDDSSFYFLSFVLDDFFLGALFFIFQPLLGLVSNCPVGFSF